MSAEIVKCRTQAQLDQALKDGAIPILQGKGSFDVSKAAYVRAAAVDSLERARRADGDTAFHVRPRGALPLTRIRLNGPEGSGSSSVMREARLVRNSVVSSQRPPRVAKGW